MLRVSHRTSWFSTLMALGTIGILLIIVTGIATVYINEMRLSRISYDDIVARGSAEWVFEYGMLKIRNHREWFQDALSPTEPDGSMFQLTSERSKNMKASYTIKSTSTGTVFNIGKDEHLIIPLFAADESVIAGWRTSKRPQKNLSVKKVQALAVSGISDLSWTIVAMSGSVSAGLTWKGNITSSAQGTIREWSADCYNSNGQKLPNCNGTYAEKLDYFFDINITVGNFLAKNAIMDPYLMIYNPGAARNITVQVHSTTPFTLPVMDIEASAAKNGILQIFRFREDKSRYYDALKYGIYNNE